MPRRAHPAEIIKALAKERRKAAKLAWKRGEISLDQYRAEKEIARELKTFAKRMHPGLLGGLGRKAYAVDVSGERVKELLRDYLGEKNELAERVLSRIPERVTLYYGPVARLSGLEKRLLERAGQPAKLGSIWRGRILSELVRTMMEEPGRAEEVLEKLRETGGKEPGIPKELKERTREVLEETAQEEAREEPKKLGEELEKIRELAGKVKEERAGEDHFAHYNALRSAIKDMIRRGEIDEKTLNKAIERADALSKSIPEMKDLAHKLRQYRARRPDFFEEKGYRPTVFTKEELREIDRRKLEKELSNLSLLSRIDKGELVDNILDLVEQGRFSEARERLKSATRKNATKQLERALSVIDELERRRAENASAVKEELLGLLRNLEETAVPAVRGGTAGTVTREVPEVREKKAVKPRGPETGEETGKVPAKEEVRRLAREERIEKERIGEKEPKRETREEGLKVSVGPVASIARRLQERRERKAERVKISEKEAARILGEINEEASRRGIPTIELSPEKAAKILEEVAKGNKVNFNKAYERLFNEAFGSNVKMREIKSAARKVKRARKLAMKGEYEKAHKLVTEALNKVRVAEWKDLHRNLGGAVEEMRAKRAAEKEKEEIEEIRLGKTMVEREIERISEEKLRKESEAKREGVLSRMARSIISKLGGIRRRREARREMKELEKSPLDYISRGRKPRIEEIKEKEKLTKKLVSKTVAGLRKAREVVREGRKLRAEKRRERIERGKRYFDLIKRFGNRVVERSRIVKRRVITGAKNVTWALIKWFREGRNIRARRRAERIERGKRYFMTIKKIGRFAFRRANIIGRRIKARTIKPLMEWFRMKREEWRGSERIPITTYLNLKFYRMRKVVGERLRGVVPTLRAIGKKVRERSRIIRSRIGSGELVRRLSGFWGRVYRGRRRRPRRSRRMREGLSRARERMGRFFAGLKERASIKRIGGGVIKSSAIVGAIKGNRLIRWIVNRRKARAGGRTAGARVREGLSRYGGKVKNIWDRIRAGVRSTRIIGKVRGGASGLVRRFSGARPRVAEGVRKIGHKAVEAGNVIKVKLAKAGEKIGSGFRALFKRVSRAFRR